MENNKVG